MRDQFRAVFRENWLADIEGICSLFVKEALSRITAETCPTKNPEMVRQLSGHVTEANAANFALPFLHVGTVTIRAGATCGEVAKQCLGQ